MYKPKVFLDSSVLIAALLSSRGGSFYILTQMRDGFSFHINEYVFAEVGEVLKTKFAAQPHLQKNLFLLLGLANVSTTPNSSRLDVRRAAKVISKNDAPILASALAHCDYLVTLDKEFLEESILADANKKGLLILTPGSFIQQLL